MRETHNNPNKNHYLYPLNHKFYTYTTVYGGNKHNGLTRQKNNTTEQNLAAKTGKMLIIPIISQFNHRARRHRLIFQRIILIPLPIGFLLIKHYTT